MIFLFFFHDCLRFYRKLIFSGKTMMSERGVAQSPKIIEHCDSQKNKNFKFLLILARVL